MKFIYSIIFLLLTTCLHSRSQSRDSSVLVLPIKTALPPDAQKLGRIKAGNNATATDCDYEAVIKSAKTKARKMGGNIVKITNLVAPAFISKCYKIEADVYFVKKLPDYEIPQPVKTVPTPASKDYALLCIYRLADTLALEGNYDLHLDNDSVICHILSKSRDSVKVLKEGDITLWAKKEQRKELKLNVKKGDTYYIRCGLIKGEVRMIPVLEQVNKTLGEKEFGSGKQLKKEGDVNYLNRIH